MGSSQSRPYQSDRRRPLSIRTTASSLSHISLRHWRPTKRHARPPKRKLVISAPVHSTSTVWSTLDTEPDELAITNTTTTSSSSFPASTYQDPFYGNDSFPSLRPYRLECIDGLSNDSLYRRPARLRASRLSIIAEESSSCPHEQQQQQQQQQQPPPQHQRRRQSLASRPASMTTGSTRSVSSTCNSPHGGRPDLEAALAPSTTAALWAPSPCSSLLQIPGLGSISCWDDEQQQQPQQQHQGYADLELSGIGFGQTYMWLDRRSGYGGDGDGAGQCLACCQGGDDECVANWL